MLENRLLFRVWSIKLRKYLTGADIWDIFDSEAKDVWGLLSEVNNPSTKYLAKQLKEYRLTFEQCTGLKDKNGKLIYEGDIVRYKLFHEDYLLGTYLNKVTFNHGSFIPICNSKVGDVEVIGNIHENPELLEKRE